MRYSDVLFRWPDGRPMLCERCGRQRMGTLANITTRVPLDCICEIELRALTTTNCGKMSQKL